VETSESHDCQDELWEGELGGDVREERRVGISFAHSLGWDAVVYVFQNLRWFEVNQNRSAGQHNQHRRREQEKRDIAWRPVGEESDVPVVRLYPGVDAGDGASTPWAGVGVGGSAEFRVGDCLWEGEGKGYESA